MAIDPFHGLVAAYRYSVLCSNGQTIEQRYSRVESRVYLSETGTATYQPREPEPVVLWSERLPDIYVDAFTPTVSVAMKDVDNYMIVWESQVDPTGSDPAAGTKIRGLIMADGISHPIVLANESQSEQATGIHALSPRVVFHDNH